MACQHSYSTCPTNNWLDTQHPTFPFFYFYHFLFAYNNIRFFLRREEHSTRKASSTYANDKIILYSSTQKKMYKLKWKNLNDDHLPIFWHVKQLMCTKTKSLSTIQRERIPSQTTTAFMKRVQEIAPTVTKRISPQVTWNRISLGLFLPKAQNFTHKVIWS